MLSALSIEAHNSVFVIHPQYICNALRRLLGSRAVSNHRLWLRYKYVLPSVQWSGDDAVNFVAPSIIIHLFYPRMSEVNALFLVLAPNIGFGLPSAAVSHRHIRFGKHSELFHISSFVYGPDGLRGNGYGYASIPEMVGYFVSVGIAVPWQHKDTSLFHFILECVVYPRAMKINGTFIMITENISGSSWKFYLCCHTPREGCRHIHIINTQAKGQGKWGRAKGHKRKMSYIQYTVGQPTVFGSNSVNNTARDTFLRRHQRTVAWQRWTEFFRPINE